MKKLFPCPECGGQYATTPGLQRWLDRGGEVTGVDGLYIRCENGHAAKLSATKRVPMPMKDFEAGKAACPNCGEKLTPTTFGAFRANGLTELAQQGGFIGKCRSCDGFVTLELRQAAN